MNRHRIAWFAAFSLACAVAAGAYVYRAVQRAPSSGDGPAPARAPGGSVGGDDIDMANAPGPVLLFRNTAVDASFGKLGVAPLDDVADRHTLAALACDRVDYAADRGVCLAADRGVVTTYSAIVFDQLFRRLFTIPLGGIPTRARVAPDGNVAAVSVFVSGHSYAGGDFSTATSVIDLRTGTLVVPNFEQLAVWRGAQPFEAVDRNFWGVTFARDSDRFYATVASAGVAHLIEGSLSGRRATLLRQDGECPSLSPDNKRLAFKHRVGNPSGVLRWGVAVLDLATSEQLLLPEGRSVDDQVAWLDDRHIMYALPAAESGTAETNTWVLEVGGKEAPRLLIPQAFSTILWRRD
jgi:hypothetical protein